MKKLIKLLSYIKPYTGLAGLNVIFNVLSALFALFSYVMAKPFLDILFGKTERVTELMEFEMNSKYFEHALNFYLTKLIADFGPSEALLLVCLIIILAALFKNGFMFLANYFMAPIRTGVVKDIRNNLYQNILKLPLSYYTESRKGDVMSRITADVQEIEFSIMSSLDMIFRDPIKILIFLGFMLATSIHLTIFVLILLPISGFIIGRLGKNLRTTSFKGQKKLGTISSIVEETLTGLRVIKAFNGEEKMTNRFQSVNSFYTRIMNKVHRRKYLATPASEFLGTIVMMILVWYGGTLVLKGTNGMTSGTFIAYLIVFSQIITPAKGFSTAYFNIQKGLASSDRIDGILNADLKIVEKEDAVSIKTFESKIEYKNVSFSYNIEPVLKNIDLTIEKGKTIALVGKSGSGKSTLVDLLPRFMDTGTGDILIDGISIRDYKVKGLRNLMGIVSQQSILFNDTFFNNIAFGVENAAEEDVIAAAKVANAHEFIMETPQGYHTNIGDAGSKLSGGQKQRVSIARAVLKNPPILILDEATSSLDTESERLVQEAIVNLMKNRTSIVIAHRLSTIKYADEICVMQEGEITERGKHGELMKKGGNYRKLHEMQMF